MAQHAQNPAADVAAADGNDIEVADEHQEQPQLAELHSAHVRVEEPIARMARQSKAKVAVSTSSNEIHIFAWRSGDWVNTAILAQRDLPVAGLDWAPNMNHIVSCSRDKCILLDIRGGQRNLEARARLGSFSTRCHLRQMVAS
ncbi:hypothetical protein Y032_0683g1500 [Ancylostoma ceylanicum]|uniref:WD domain, G-beta repeat protein n=1 Tax=Ancylostoma ceylanicum TaxID=53326 RepID=A0A016WHA1_9BILA|nr:hypothetical protein Y032_0683g1500 [Ancylostoma ceylanicum]